MRPTISSVRSTKLLCSMSISTRDPSSLARATNGWTLSLQSSVEMPRPNWVSLIEMVAPTPRAATRSSIASGGGFFLRFDAFAEIVDRCEGVFRVETLDGGNFVFNRVSRHESRCQAIGGFGGLHPAAERSIFQIGRAHV